MQENTPISNLVTYKCPNCGSAIIFNGASGKFTCESCNGVFTKEYLDAVLATQAPEFLYTQPLTDETRQNNELENMDVYSCRFCGAQIIVDNTTAASQCPYCDNPIIMSGKLSGMNKPDYIIPFKLDKSSAVAALSNFYKNKRLLPKAFTANNKIQEIKGVYVPFWLYDCDVRADITFDAAYIKSHVVGKYVITETSHFDADRSGTISFQRVPVDGSSKMDNAYMDAIEPYDYSELLDFNPAYLSGYLADKYDINANQSIERASERIKAETINTFKQTASKYDSVVVKTQDICPILSNHRYALFPVWILNTKYDNKKYTFAMNGQTGKLIGTLPTDKKRFIGYWLGLSSLLFAIIHLLLLIIFI